jgi:hypothetical protein
MKMITLTFWRNSLAAVLLSSCLFYSNPSCSDGLFGGGSNPLGSLFGQQSGGSGNSGGSGGLLGSLFSGVQNTSLGPVGRHLLGRELASRLVGANTIADVDDPRVKYVRIITMSLLRESLRPYEYKDQSVFVIENDESINAHAAPGGFIFVTSGLLKFVENEDELAFVLAHEVAHVEMDHGLNAIKQSAGQSIAGKAFGFSEEFANSLADGYSQDLEGEADFRAGQILARTGYDPTLGAKVIARLDELTGRKHATGYPKDRYNNVIRGVRKAGGPKSSSADARSQRFQTALR